MQIDFPNFPAIEDMMLQVALDRFGEHVRSAKNLGPAIVELSNFYNAPLDERGACPHSKYHQAARMLFFTVADMPKAYAVAAETDTLQALPQKSKLKIFDAGVGYGAQSLGLLSYLFQADHQRRIQLDVVDRDTDALEALDDILGACQRMQIFGDVALNSRRMNLNQSFQSRDRYDIIIMGSTLCELRPDAQFQLLANLLSALTDSGILCVIEPALKATSRNLHQLRNRMLAEQQCRILAPCTHQENCPCLENEKDWCHESRQTLLPPRARQLSITTGLRTQDVKWSYMTLTRARNSAEQDADVWRIVSDLMKPKGKQEIFVCGKPGRLRSILQKRDKSSANTPFKKLQRGQRIRFTHTQIHDDFVMLDRESSVSIEVNPAKCSAGVLRP